MTDITDLLPIVRRVAFDELGSDIVQNVGLSRTSDAEGQDSLKMTVLLTEDGLGRIEDDQLVDILVALRRALADAGVEQSTVVEYHVPGEPEDDE